MSDLEATRSRAQAAAPITAIANGKLRAFAGNGTLFAETDGLVDAFAEVFARIAASSQSIEPHDSSADIDNVQIAEDNKPAENKLAEDDGASTESESSDSDSAIDVNVGPLVAVADQQVAVESEIGSKSLDKESDHVIADDVTIAAIEVQPISDRGLARQKDGRGDHRTCG